MPPPAAANLVEEDEEDEDELEDELAEARALALSPEGSSGLRSMLGVLGTESAADVPAARQSGTCSLREAAAAAAAGSGFDGTREDVPT